MEEIKDTRSKIKKGLEGLTIALCPGSALKFVRDFNHNYPRYGGESRHEGYFGASMLEVARLCAYVALATLIIK